MNRRAFIVSGGAAILVARPAAEAQQAAKVARIGYLSPNLASSPHLRDTFLQGLRDLGYVEGRNVVIEYRDEYRDAEGKRERLPALAAELVALKVDVIVTEGGNTVAPSPPSKRPEPSPLSSLLLPIRWGAGSSPALLGRAAMSRGSASPRRSRQGLECSAGVPGSSGRVLCCQVPRERTDKDMLRSRSRGTGARVRLKSLMRRARRYRTAFSK